MVPGMTDDFAALLERGRTGDKRAVARLISLIEQGGETARSVLTQLWPHTGRARIFGITGPPGAGKSTLTNALTKCWRAKGLRVGIIAVDPTSPFTGGAILGDRVRMGDLTLDTGVFIRSMGTPSSRPSMTVSQGSAYLVPPVEMSIMPPILANSTPWRKRSCVRPMCVGEM